MNQYYAMYEYTIFLQHVLHGRNLKYSSETLLLLRQNLELCRHKKLSHLHRIIQTIWNCRAIHMLDPLLLIVQSPFNKIKIFEWLVNAPDKSLELITSTITLVRQSLYISCLVPHLEQSPVSGWQLRPEVGVQRKGCLRKRGGEQQSQGFPSMWHQQQSSFLRLGTAKQLVTVTNRSLTRSSINHIHRSVFQYTSIFPLFEHKIFSEYFKKNNRN